MNNPQIKITWQDVISEWDAETVCQILEALEVIELEIKRTVVNEMAKRIDKEIMEMCKDE